MIPTVTPASSDFRHRHTQQRPINAREHNTPESFKDVLERHMSVHKGYGVVVERKPYVKTVLSEYVPLHEYQRYD